MGVFRIVSSDVEPSGEPDAQAHRTTPSHPATAAMGLSHPQRFIFVAVLSLLLAFSSFSIRDTDLPTILLQTKAYTKDEASLQEDKKNRAHDIPPKQSSDSRSSFARGWEDLTRYRHSPSAPRPIQEPCRQKRLLPIPCSYVRIPCMGGLALLRPRQSLPFDADKLSTFHCASSLSLPCVRDHLSCTCPLCRVLHLCFRDALPKKGDPKRNVSFGNNLL